MKKGIKLTLFVALGIAMLATAAAGAPNTVGGSGITGTSHDLSTTGVATSFGIDTSATGTNNRICIFCHAPHNTKKPGSVGADGKTYDYLPLWNHQFSTNTTWVPYTTGSAIVGDPGDPNNPANGIFATADVSGGPGSVSKLCLSCHDGSVAVSAYGSSPSSGTKMSGNKQIGAGGDLSNHHPIGFNYTDAWTKDLEIADPTTVLSSASGIRIKDVLIGNNMECITCHDVHNSKNEAGAEKFLWKSDQHSNLCLTCHKK